MNAVEARVLTETRRAESPADYRLRMDIYPHIQWMAGACWDKTEFRPSGWRLNGHVWETYDGFDLTPQIVERLQAEGFKVDVFQSGAGGGEEVRVSW